MNLLSRYARRAPTAVSLENLFRFGRIGALDKAQRLRNAQFLHEELQIRIAQRVIELEALPLGLPQTAPIRDVIGWYTDYFERVAESPMPNNEADEEAFTDLLRFLLQDNSAVIETTSRGVLEVRSALRGFSVEDQLVVDRILNRFYLARIGLRFLIEHHIESAQINPGFAGIIEGACRPEYYVRSAAEDAGMLCERHLGSRPPFLVREVPLRGRGDVSFTYVPAHLQYMLLEVLKNAFKAVADRFGDAADTPPVEVLIVEGAEDVTIRISDQGGGIERSAVPLVWSYLHSTASTRRVQEQLLELDGGRAQPILCGYGVGLPLSRLYARYFGGDLDLKSLHGYGTDVFLHLPRLGHNCENLPDAVSSSPAGGTSSLQRGQSQIFFSGSRSDWRTSAHLGQTPPFQRLRSSLGDPASHPKPKP